jgi:iron complex outermembrane receptor protein
MIIRTQRMRNASGFAVVCAVMSVLGTGVARSQQDRSYHFDIAKQSLSQALRNFAHVCGQEVVFTEDVVAGQATSLRGEYTVQGALEQLLQGTDLVAERSASGAIMIRRRMHATGADVRTPLGFGRTASAAALQINTAAVAADPPASDAPPPAPSRVAAAAAAPAAAPALEEVIVTGTKRAENVQSVPNSVLVVTAASMERANIRDFDDLVKIAPSLTITKTSQPANNSINIRGIGTYAYSIATEPSVAVVVDDIPQAFQAEAFASFVDVKQVEVLRGPQNTLFGKSASAGVVNITTESPTATFTSRAEVMHTFDDESRYQATLSGPIVDGLKFRLSVNHSEYQGNVHDLTTGTWVNGEQDTTVRGKLLWTPTDDWKVTLSPYFSHTPASCCQGALYFISPGVTFAKANIPQSVILAGINPSPDNQNARYDVPARGDARDYGSGLKIERELGSLSLALISSYDHYNLNDLQDTDSSDFNFQSVAPKAPYGGSANGGFFRVSSVTDELRLTSGDTGAFRYVAGLYYSRTGSVRYFVRGSNTLGTFNTLTQLPSTNNITYSAYTSSAVAKNFAVYGQSTYDILERLALTTGLRVNREKISYNFNDYGNNVIYGSPACSTKSPTLAISTCNQSTSVTGRASLQFHVTDDIMVFGGYARGYKGLAYDLTSTLTIRTPLASGPLKGIPVADAVAAKQPVPAETVNSYEVGLTAFDEEFQGFQAQSRDEITGQNLLNSIGRVSSRGVETELAAVIGDFTLNGGGAYDRAIMERFPNATCFPQQTAAQGCVGGQQDLSGKPLFNAPKWNFSFNSQYDVPVSFHDFRPFITAGVRWQSQVVFNLLQDPDSVQPSYALLDLALGTQSDHFKLTVFVNNVLDKRYALTRGRSGVFNISQTANPSTDAISWTPARDSFRYYGIRLGASF